MMHPLIITATPNICWLQPRVEYPQTTKTISEEAFRCKEAGATILHTHGQGKWEEVLKEIRMKSDIIIQCGMSSLTIEERMNVFKSHGDMISIILNHHDEAFVGADINVLHPREELVEYARMCKINKVIPEWEVWHAGSIWNLNYLINNKHISPPFVTTLFFGWPGGTWSPATIEEYQYRRRMMPEGCVCNVSIMGEGQREIITAAILNGDHVRVGTEDSPYTHDGKIASTYELVSETAEMARTLGRPLATVKQAKEMIGICE